MKSSVTRGIVGLLHRPGKISKDAWKRIALNVAAVSIVLSLFLRAFFVNGGFIIYRDFYWPYASNLLLNSWNFLDPNLVNVNAGQADPIGMFRSVFTWPLGLLAVLRLSSDLIERLFFVGVFCIVYGILYLVSLTVDGIAGRTPPEIVRVLVLLVISSNFYVMQTITWYTLWLGFALLMLMSTTLYRWLKSSHQPSLWLTVLSWLLLSILDVRFIMWSPAVFVTVAACLLVMVKHRMELLRRLLQVSMTIAFIIAPFYISLYGLNIVSGNAVGNAINIITSAYAYLSRAPTVIGAATLTGYWWSTVNYIPPASNLNAIWILSLFVLPLTLGIATIRRSAESLVFAAIGIIGLDLSIGTSSPVNSALFSLVGHTSWGQLILVPFLSTYYSLIMLACGCSLCLYWLCLRIVPHVLNASALPRLAILFLLIIPLFFASWQFYNGSLYPSGNIGPGSDVSKPIGVLQPSSPPPAVLEAYSWLGNQPGIFNTVWVPGTFGYAYTWNNKSSPFNEYYSPPQPFVSSLIYFTFGPMSNLTQTLNEYHVRYVIVQNDTEPITLSTFYGVESLTSVRNSLASNGLVLAESFSNSVWIYLNPSSPPYISCQAQAGVSGNLSNSVLWRDVVPSYWAVSISGRNPNCQLVMPMAYDKGWVAVSSGASISFPLRAGNGFLEFNLPGAGSFSVIYLPYFYAVICLVYVSAAIVVLSVLALNTEKARMIFRTLFPLQVLLYGVLALTSIILLDDFIAAISVLSLVITFGATRLARR